MPWIAAFNIASNVEETLERPGRQASESATSSRGDFASFWFGRMCQGDLDKLRTAEGKYGAGGRTGVLWVPRAEGPVRSGEVRAPEFDDGALTATRSTSGQH